jgi:UDP-N-acetylmuramyl pentapeptide phosphotransferase/UDP-N-acetylglucosamine-1-phosphate transferase
MTPDLVWMMIIANAAIAAFTIANTWMLAWYNKKRQKKSKQRKTDTDENKPTQRSVTRGLSYAIFFVLSIVTLVLSMLVPNPSTIVQIFQVSLSIGFSVLAVVLSLISSLIELTRDHVKVTARLTEMIEAIAQSLPTKSPNPTVDSDARKNGARGSP